MVAVALTLLQPFAAEKRPVTKRGALRVAPPPKETILFRLNGRSVFC